MAKRPTSVVMVSASFHPYLGGAEKQALELSVALRARGAAVRVLTRRLPGLSAYDEERGVPIERLWCAGEGVVNAATFMFSLFFYLILKAGTYDAVHVHLAGSPALAAALAGRLRGKRVFVKLGGGRGIGELAASSKSRAGRLKLRALSFLKPQLIVVTRDLLDEAARFLGSGVPIHMIPNGVDTDRYRPADAAQKAALRADLNFPPGLAFVYAGRLSPEKRLPEFIETWAAACKRAKAFFVVVGEGIDRERIVDEARRAGAAEKVLVLPARADVETVYAAADIFVLPSISEGLSNALLEAMSAGLAILASRVGGAVEAVTEGQSGFLFAPTDAVELRRQIEKLLAKPELAANLGKAARQTALSRYALAKLAKDYEEIYHWGLP